MSAGLLYRAVCLGEALHQIASITVVSAPQSAQNPLCSRMELISQVWAGMDQWAKASTLTLSVPQVLQTILNYGGVGVTAGGCGFVSAETGSKVAFANQSRHAIAALRSRGLAA